MSVSGRLLRPPAGRQRFGRARARAVAECAGLLLLLGAVGWLLVAPHDVAGIRLAGVALGWWAVLGAHLLAMLLLARRDRPAGRPPERPRGDA